MYGPLGLGSGCAAAMSCCGRLHDARGHGGPTRRVRRAPRRLATMVRDPPAGGEAGLRGTSPTECPSVVTLRGGTSQAHDSAGGLCYGDGRMRFLLMWLTPHLQQSRDEEKAPIFTGLREGAHQTMTCKLPYSLSFDSIVAIQGLLQWRATDIMLHLRIVGLHNHGGLLREASCGPRGVGQSTIHLLLNGWLERDPH